MNTKQAKSQVIVGSFPFFVSDNRYRWQLVINGHSKCFLEQRLEAAGIVNQSFNRIGIRQRRRLSA